ncbi:hypothetical protein [Desulfonatronum parangueonense]
MHKMLHPQRTLQVGNIAVPYIGDGRVLLVEKTHLQALAMQDMNRIKAMRLIHARGYSESGSLEMGEIDEALKELGIRVWEWPIPHFDT